MDSQSAQVSKRYREDDLWTFVFLWIFGLPLMDCLWNVCGLLGMDFSVSLIGFPQPFVCVWAGCASHGRLRDGRALLALIGRIYTGLLSGIFLTLCVSSCKGRNTTARNSNSPEESVDEKIGDVIYWTITRQMYHTSFKRDGLRVC